MAKREGRPVANRWYVGEMVRALGPTLTSLPGHLLSPRRYRLEDAVTIVWFATVGVILLAFLVASGMV